MVNFDAGFLVAGARKKTRHATGCQRPEYIQNGVNCDYSMCKEGTRSMTTKKELTAMEIEQRQNAARKHGVYAVQARGKNAMTPAQRSALADVQDQLSTRPGVIEAMAEQTANSLMLCQIAQAHVIEQHQAGVPLDKIPLFGKLPIFWNSAGRALKALYEVLPDENKLIDVETILESLRGDYDDQQQD